MKLQKSLLASMLLFTCGAAFAGQNEPAQDALARAIMGGADAKRVAEMLNTGADVNAKAPHGPTALSLAVQWSAPEIVRMLLDRGADVNARQSGSFYLVSTSDPDQLKKIRLFLDKVNNPHKRPVEMPEPDFDPNIEVRPMWSKTGEPIGLTPLMIAAYAGNTEAMPMLLDKGADVNAAGWGKTALMYAAVSGKREAVELLLKHGADREAKSSDGKTALDIAKEKKHKEVVKLLVSGKP